MTGFQALAVVSPFIAAVLTGLLVLGITYLGNKASAKKQKATALRQSAAANAPLSNLSEAERATLALHIETVETFVETVKKASAAVEESARRVHLPTAALSALEKESR